MPILKNSPGFFSLFLLLLCTQVATAQNYRCINLFKKQTSQNDNSDEYAAMKDLLLNANGRFARSKSEGRISYIDPVTHQVTHSYVLDYSTASSRIEAASGSVVSLRKNVDPENRVHFSSDGSQIRISMYPFAHEGRSNFNLPPRSDQIFSSVTGKLIQDLPISQIDGVNITRISGNFETAAYRNEDNTYSILDLSSGTSKVLTRLPAKSVVLSDNGRYIVIKNRSEQTVYRKLENGTLEVVLKTSRPFWESDHSPNAFIAQNADVIVLYTSMFNATVFNLNTGKVITSFPVLRDYNAFISPNGKHLILGKGKTIIIRDLTTGQKISQFKLSEAGAQIDHSEWVRFSSDSRYVSVVVTSNADLTPSYYKYIIDIEYGTIERLSGFN